MTRATPSASSAFTRRLPIHGALPAASLVITLAAPATLVGQGIDVRVNTDPPGRVQNETSLVVHSSMPGTMLIVFNDFPYAGGPGIGVARSTDGGTTWTHINLPPPASMVDAFDPISAADPAGWLYAGCITTAGMSPGASMVHLWGSPDGGATWTWGQPIAVDLTNLLDKPHLTSDLRPASPWSGTKYAAWIRDFATVGPWSDLFFSAGTGAPPSFALPQRISDLPPGVARSHGPNVAVAADGSVHVVWLDFDVTTGGQTPGMLYLDSSFDGGVTFGVDRPVTALPFLTVPNRLSNFAGVADVVARSFPCLATSPVNAMEMYVVWPADPDVPLAGDESDVFFARTLDGGATWSMPVSLSTPFGGHEFAPWIAVEPNGTIDVAWYEAPPNDMGFVSWAVMLTRSMDGGITWTTPIPVNDVPFPSPIDAFGQRWLGEYLGLAVDATSIRLAFTSSTTDAFGDIFFDRIRLCPEDLDGDTVVGFADMLILLARFGPALPGEPADFDGTGQVDFGDLLQLLSRWGPC